MDVGDLGLMPLRLEKMDRKENSHCGTRLHAPEGCPLGQELLLPHEGVAALLAGLAPVLILQGLQLNLQGVEDRMVFVHRSVATATILTESEDFSACLPRP